MLQNKSKSFPLSDHCDGRKFFNPHTQDKFHYFYLLKWLITRKRPQWPKWLKNTYLPQLPSNLKKNEIALTFINHASFLIQTASLNILIDPIFSRNPGPHPLFGFKRIRSPGICFSHLPPIDIVLISHNHYDHLDINTLKNLKQSHHPLFISGLGNKRFLNSFGFKNIFELDWWEKHTHKDAEIIFVPAQHSSARTIVDRNKTLWGGFVIQTKGKKIYHIGDSGYGPHFKEINKKIGPLDASLLSIGCYEPRWFMKKMHINPEEAVRVHIELHSKLSIPMHYATFPLSDEPYNQPLRDLQLALKKHRLSEFKILDFGETHIIH